MILPYRDYQPQVGTGGWVAPNATLIGDVVLGEDVSLWYNTVVRGDVHAIRIGAQQYLERFYQSFGFVTVSAPYDEDGIQHVDMLRAETAA